MSHVPETSSFPVNGKTHVAVRDLGHEGLEVHSAYGKLTLPHQSASATKLVHTHPIAAAYRAQIERKILDPVHTSNAVLEQCFKLFGRGPQGPHAPRFQSCLEIGAGHRLADRPEIMKIFGMAQAEDSTRRQAGELVGARTFDDYADFEGGSRPAPSAGRYAGAVAVGDALTVIKENHITCSTHNIKVVLLSHVDYNAKPRFFLDLANALDLPEDMPFDVVLQAASLPVYEVTVGESGSPGFQIGGYYEYDDTGAAQLTQLVAGSGTRPGEAYRHPAALWFYAGRAHCPSGSATGRKYVQAVYVESDGFQVHFKVYVTSKRMSANFKTAIHPGPIALSRFCMAGSTSRVKPAAYTWRLTPVTRAVVASHSAFVAPATSYYDQIRSFWFKARVSLARWYGDYEDFIWTAEHPDFIPVAGAQPQASFDTITRRYLAAGLPLSAARWAAAASFSSTAALIEPPTATALSRPVLAYRLVNTALSLPDFVSKPDAMPIVGRVLCYQAPGPLPVNALVETAFRLTNPNPTDDDYHRIAADLAGAAREGHSLLELREHPVTDAKEVGSGATFCGPHFTSGQDEPPVHPTPFAPTAHNLCVAIATRHSRQQTRPDVAALEKFVRSYHAIATAALEQLADMATHGGLTSVTSLETILADLPPAVRRKYRDCVFNYEAADAARRVSTIHDFSIHAFVKREVAFAAEHGEPIGKPRLIQAAAQPTVDLLMQPVARAMALGLKACSERPLREVVDGARANTPQTVHDWPGFREYRYAGGMPIGKGSFVAGSGCFEGDFSSYDATISDVLLALEVWFATSIASIISVQPAFQQDRFFGNFADGYDHYIRTAMTARIVKSGTCRAPSSRLTYRIYGTRASGDPFTSIGNTIINMACAHSFWQNRDVSGLFQGDDSFLYCSGSQISPESVQAYSDHATALGFKPDFTFHEEVSAAAFCGCMPVRRANVADMGDVARYVFAPIYGRMTFKLGVNTYYGRDPPNPHVAYKAKCLSVNAWLNSVIVPPGRPAENPLPHIARALAPGTINVWVDPKDVLPLFYSSSTARDAWSPVTSHEYFVACSKYYAARGLVFTSAEWHDMLASLRSIDPVAPRPHYVELLYAMAVIDLKASHGVYDPTDWGRACVVQAKRR